MFVISGGWLIVAKKNPIGTEFVSGRILTFILHRGYAMNFIWWRNTPLPLLSTKTVLELDEQISRDRVFLNIPF